MKKALLAIFIVLFAAGVYAEKVINVTTAKISTMTVQAHANGDAVCILDGTIYDSDGNSVKSISMTLGFDELPAQVRNNLNNVMKHMSREMNKEGANEDEDNWVDQ
jgi:hypothetical protein